MTIASRIFVSYAPTATPRLRRIEAKTWERIHPPPYPNWPRGKGLKNPSSVGSNPTGGTIVLSRDIVCRWLVGPVLCEKRCLLVGRHPRKPSGNLCSVAFVVLVEERMKFPLLGGTTKTTAKMKLRTAAAISIVDPGAREPYRSTRSSVRRSPDASCGRRCPRGQVVAAHPSMLRVWAYPFQSLAAARTAVVACREP